MSNEKTAPSRSLKVKIGSNEYEIKFPNNGQLIDIERRKIEVSGGNSKMMLMGDNTSQLAYLTNEMIATFSVLIPKLTKDLTVKSLYELDPQQSKHMLEEYQKYYSWMREWIDYLNPEVKEEEKEEEETE